MNIKRCFYILFLIFIFFSCETVKHYYMDDINTIDNRIVYHIKTYQSTIHYRNGEYIEDEKIEINTEYFDINNKIIKSFNEKNGILINIFEYDINGNNIGIRTYNEQKILLYRNEFIINNGKIISIKNYDNNDVFLAEIKFIYDFNNNIIMRIVYGYGIEHRFIDYWMYVYVNKKLYSEIYYHYENEEPLFKYYIYDNNERIIEINSYYDGWLINSEIIDYDENNREIKRTYYNYDSNKNKIPIKILYYEYQQYI